MAIDLDVGLPVPELSKGEDVEGMQPVLAAGGIADRLRRTPIGILLISALMLIVAIGLTAGGIFLLISSPNVSWWAAALGIVGGPAILYLTWDLLQQNRWAWMALVALTLLLLISSLLRLFVSADAVIAPIGEIVVEIAAGYYLTRPSVRGRFRSR